MQIDVVILGTAGSSPTKTRSLPGVAMIYEGKVMLFDCGEGTQFQMLKYGVNTSRIKAIFISHVHGDHVIGIAGLVRTLALNGRREPLLIFVPKGYENMIKPLISFDRAMMSYQILIKGVGSGKIFEDRDFSVSAFKLKHTIPTLGYVLHEKDRKKFLKEKCFKLGIKGTMFSELQKKGAITMGKKRISIDDVTELKKGKKIVYATDTRPIQTTVSAAKDAELLIHESSFSINQKDLAVERGHSTAEEVAVLAKKARVKTLVLTHISARYKEIKPLEKEARAKFRNAVVAGDGYKLTV